MKLEYSIRQSVAYRTNKFRVLFLFLAAPSSVLAQDFHKGGFFDSDVSQGGFFNEAQAGIPIKNNMGVITTRPKKDSWEVHPDKLAGIPTDDAKVASDKQTIKDEVSNSDSFEVKKEPTD